MSVIQTQTMRNNFKLSSERRKNFQDLHMQRNVNQISNTTDARDM